MKKEMSVPLNKFLELYKSSMFLYKCRRILDKREKKQHNSTSFGQHNVL